MFIEKPYVPCLDLLNLLLMKMCQDSFHLSEPPSQKRGSCSHELRGNGQASCHCVLRDRITASDSDVPRLHLCFKLKFFPSRIYIPILQ